MKHKQISIFLRREREGGGGGGGARNPRDPCQRYDLVAAEVVRMLHECEKKTKSKKKKKKESG